MKKIYIIKYEDTYPTINGEQREQIIEAKNEARAVIKFNRKNKEYIRWMNNISIKEITNK